MDLSKLGGNDRLALGAAAVVVVTALLSLGNGWGGLMALSLLAGVGAVAVLLLPQLSASTTLPTTKGVALLALGGIATISTGLMAINWIGWIPDHLASFDTIQFLVGLAAAIVLLALGYVAFQAERGSSTPPA